MKQCMKVPSPLIISLSAVPNQEGLLVGGSFCVLIIIIVIYTMALRYTLRFEVGQLN